MKKLKNLWSSIVAHYKNDRRNEIKTRINNSIRICDEIINDQQAIALKVEGVVIDYIIAEAKTADIQRIINKLVSTRTIERDLQFRKNGLTIKNS